MKISPLILSLRLLDQDTLDDPVGTPLYLWSLSPLLQVAEEYVRRIRSSMVSRHTLCAKLWPSFDDSTPRI